MTSGSSTIAPIDHARVERGVRILEDDLHPPPQAPHARRGRAFPGRRRRRRPGRRSGARDGGCTARERRLAATGLPDEPERLAGAGRQTRHRRSPSGRFRLSCRRRVARATEPGSVSRAGRPREGPCRPHRAGQLLASVAAHQWSCGRGVVCSSRPARGARGRSGTRSRSAARVGRGRAAGVAPRGRFCGRDPTGSAARTSSRAEPGRGWAAALGSRPVVRARAGRAVALSAEAPPLWMGRADEDVGGRRPLDDSAGVHDLHEIAELGHDSEVVGDEDDGGLVLRDEPI